MFQLLIENKDMTLITTSFDETLMEVTQVQLEQIHASLHRINT